MSQPNHAREAARDRTIMHVSRIHLGSCLVLASAMLCSTTVHAAPPVDAHPPADVRQGSALKTGGAVSMGIGAALLVPMAVGIAEYYGAGSEIRRRVEHATAESRPFTPDEFELVERAYGHSKSMKSLAIGTGIAGGLLMLGGLSAFLVGARQPLASPPSRRVRITPHIRPSSCRALGVCTLVEVALGCEVCFGRGRCALVIDPRGLDRPVSLARPELFRSIQEHLARAFKRSTGMSPAKFRRA